MVTPRERFKVLYPNLDYDVLITALIDGTTCNRLERERKLKFNETKTDRSNGYEKRK